MINLSEETSAWRVDEKGWSISPGVPWCAKGYRIRVGKMCLAGNWLVVGNGFKAGDWFTVGDGFTADDWFNAGNSFKAGNNARGIAPLGYADGYWKCLSAVNDVAYIGAGCRWFPLAVAIQHWRNHKEDRRNTLALMQAAIALAKLHGLRHDH